MVGGLAVIRDRAVVNVKRVADAGHIVVVAVSQDVARYPPRLDVYPLPILPGDVIGGHLVPERLEAFRNAVKDVGAEVCC